MQLAAHKRAQGTARLQLGPVWQDNGLVFATDTGTPLNHRNLVNRHFRRILESAGLATDFRLYDLRHSCATLLLANGENPKIVSERLGHASVVLTLDTYSHVLPDMQRAATDRLESLLFTPTGTL